MHDEEDNVAAFHAPHGRGARRDPVRAGPRRRRLARRHRRSAARARRRRPAHQGHLALAQLRPPGGAQRRARARPRRRRGDDRRRPAGPAGADPGDARRVARAAPTSSTRCASSREGETRFKLATARWFYRLFAKLARIELAQDSGDFRLMDRAPLDALLSMPERNRFLRGMTVWVGFTQTAVTYQRDARAGGSDEVHAGEDAGLRVRRDHELLARAAAGRDAARLRVLDPRLPRHPAHGRRALRGHLLARRAHDDRDRPAARRHPADHGRDHRRVRRPDLRRGQAPAALRRARARQRGGATASE